jgi:protein gp37
MKSSLPRFVVASLRIQAERPLSSESSIEWTDATWNPVRGCNKISPGCKHCYAETFAERWRGVPGHPYEQGFDVRLVPEKLTEPLRWTKPRQVFVNSMSDLFHEDVPDNFIDQVVAVMAVTARHTYQVLTKRAERMAAYFNGLRLDRVERAARALGHSIQFHGTSLVDWPLPNVWLGVSVEDREHGLPRLNALRRTPAAVRMVSIEPLLEDLGQIDMEGIGWVIVGGESGAGARPFFIQWARDIRDQCKSAGVPFFFKQAGSHVAWDGWSPPGGWWPKGTRTEDTGRGHFLVKLKSKKGGELEELPEDLRVRDFPR